MVHIGNSLAYLLVRHPKISLHNLGTFRSVWATESGWNVDFTPGADGHSSSLLDFVIKQGEYSDIKAIEVLDHLVSKINRELQQDGQVELDGFGRLLLRNGTCHFLPMGMEEVVPVPILEVESPSLLDVADSEPEIVDHRGSSSRFVFWSLLLLVVAYIGIRFVDPALIEPFETKISRIFIGKEADTQPPVEEKIQPPVVEIEPSDLATETNGLVDSAVMTNSAISDSTASSPFRYEVIIASFATLRQAEKYVAEMKSKGHNFHVMDSRMPGNRKKVSWGYYSNEEEANEVLRKVQKEFEAGAWVAKVPNP